MRTFVTGDKMIDYPVPQLLPEVKRTAPAFVLRLQVTKPADRAGTDYGFLVARNLKFPLQRFTVAYAYTYLVDGERRAASGEIVYEGGDINRSNFIVCRINDTNTVLSSGFRVRVTEAVGEDGEIYSYGEEDFSPDTARERSFRYSYAGEDVPAAAPKKAAEKKKAKKPVSRLAHTLIALASVLAGVVVVCALVFAAFFGFHYVMYNYLMPEADALAVAGRQDLAEDYVNRYLANNYFFRMYKNEVTDTVEGLCEEGRWNEAAAISKTAPFGSLSERVNMRALENALEGARYREAYVYAASLDGEYAELVAQAAASHLVDEETGEWNEDAYLTALKAEKDGVADLIANDLAEWYWERGERARAEAVAEQLGDAALREAWEERRKQDEFDRILASGDSGTILAYLEAHPDAPNRDALAGEYRRRIFDAALAEGDYPTAFQMADAYGYDVSGLTEDFGVVRSALAHAYFRLTPDQMRAYHAETVSASNTVVFLRNGVVGWTEGGETRQTDGVVSVSAGDYVTCILKSDGTATAFANHAAGNTATAVSSFETDFIAAAGELSDVVAMSSGERHTAFLRADGTVAVLGDNTFGQADTAGWTDIVAVAAGRRFTAGLRSDGTLVACGSNAAGQCDVAPYRNAVDIRAGAQSLVILFSDGTVAVAGERSMGLADAEGLRDVVKLRAGLNMAVAQLSDGSFRAVGGAAEGAAGSVSSWMDVSDFAVGNGFVCRQDSTGAVFSNGVNVPKNP